METPAFTDKTAAPTEKAILAALGAAAPSWRALFERIQTEHPDLRQAWSYYADGRSWLLKVTRGAKTVFWLSVYEGCFHVGFYFPERLTPELLNSDLSRGRKAQIRGARPTGKLRPVSVELGPESGIADVLRLIDLKKTLK